MAGSFKDAMRKSGLAPAAPAPAAKPAKPAPRGPDLAEPLPDDESLPPRFDAPALTRARPSQAKKKL